VDPDPGFEKFGSGTRSSFFQKISAYLRLKIKIRTLNLDQNADSDPDPDPGAQENADPDPGVPKMWIQLRSGYKTLPRQKYI